MDANKIYKKYTKSMIDKKYFIILRKFFRLLK